MSTNSDLWDPAQYLRYGDQRLRPALDLLAQVGSPVPARVVDLGCGAGQLCALMKQRWPAAEVVGLDASEQMLAAARREYPDCRFESAEIGHWAPEAQFDVIYSNAALQWLPDHPVLLPRILRGLKPGGWLAVQMPAMHDEPLRQLQLEVARDPRWAAQLAGVPRQPSILTMAEYAALLRPRCATLDLWQTTYLHVLEGEDAALQWAAGTSLRPYLTALPQAQREAFKADYARALAPYYPPEADGRTLLPFKRLFMVATV